MNHRATNEMRLTYHQELKHVTMKLNYMYICMSRTKIDSLPFAFRAVNLADSSKPERYNL